MDYKNIIFDTCNRIGKITFNRPESLNAVDYATIVEFKDSLLRVEKDPEIRVAIVTGSGGKSFIVGADRNEIKMQFQDKERAKNFETYCRETFSLLANLEKPSICSMNGYAFGLGLQLALACTFRIVSSNAKLGLPEINLGFFPSMGATQRLTRLIGESKATEMILTGKPIEAEEAFRIGLANRKISPTELSDYVEKFAENLAEKSPITMKLAMAAIRNGSTMKIGEGLAYEAKLADICLETEDSKEGVLAFTEKRKPIFKGK
jgi:enoyl-CoA hydratase